MLLERYSIPSISMDLKENIVVLFILHYGRAYWPFCIETRYAGFLVRF
jgi:hypothetical protein